MMSNRNHKVSSSGHHKHIQVGGPTTGNQVTMNGVKQASIETDKPKTKMAHYSGPTKSNIEYGSKHGGRPNNQGSKKMYKSSAIYHAKGMAAADAGAEVNKHTYK